MLAEAAGGVYNGSQLRLICDVADDVSVFLKVTEDQRIGFMVPKDKLLELHAKLSKSGILLKHYRNHSILSPKACLGELCSKCEQDALGDAIEISPMLNEKFKESFSALNIGMNGCETACVASATDDIHVVGNSKGYKLFIGGKISGEPKLAEHVVDGIPRPKIGEAISIILDTYSQNKQENESLSDVIARLGMDLFKESIQKAGMSSNPPEEGGESPPAESSGAQELSEDTAAVPITESPLEEVPLEVAGAEAAPSEVPAEAAPVEEAPAEEIVSSEAGAAPSEVLAEEEAPLEVAGAEAAPSEIPAEEAPAEEIVSTEAAAPSEVAVEEEVPLEVAGAEAMPSDVPAEVSVSEEISPPQEDTAVAPDPAEGDIPVGEETMKEEEIAIDEPVSENPAEVAEGAPPASEEKPAVEVKDLDIVDDTASAEETPPLASDGEAPQESPVAEAAHDEDHSSPEPIDHGLGEEPSLQTVDNSTSSLSSEEGISEEAATPMGLDEDVKSSEVTASNKVSIQVRGKYFMVILSDGSDFRVPFKTIAEGKVFEMQLEDETFIIENINGKLQVKYGDFEMHVPLDHASASEVEEIEGAA